MSDLPMRAVRDRRCPSGSRSTRSGRATGCRTRRRWCRPRSRRSSIRRLLAPGCRSSRRPASCTRRGCPQLADAAELIDDCSASAGRELPVLVPNERGLDRALELGLPAHRDLRQRHRDLRAEEPQPQPRRAVRDVRADRTPGARRRARRARLRLDVLRRPVGGRRAGRAGRRRRPAALRPRRRASCQPRRHHRRRHRRPRRPPWSAPSTPPGIARRRSSRCTSTTPTARRWPTPGRAAGRHHDVRRERRRPRRLPVRQERDRQPRHRGPGLDAHRPRHRARRRPRRAGRDDQRWMAGAPRPAQPLGRRACPRRCCQNRRHEPGRLPAHRCTQDRDDVPPGPAGAQPASSPGTTSTTRWPLHGAVPVPGRARPARAGLGRAPGHADGAWDVLVSGSAGRAAP